MEEAIILRVRFQWEDIAKARSYGDVYEGSGLLEAIKESAEDPGEWGGEIIRQNIHVTPYVASRIATIISRNKLRDTVKKSGLDDIKHNYSMEALTEISFNEYVSGFEAGVIGPEICSCISSRTMRFMRDHIDDFSETSPVFWLFQRGSDEFVEPHRGDAKEFVRKIKSFGQAEESTNRQVEEFLQRFPSE